MKYKIFLFFLCLAYLQAYQRNNIFVGIGIGLLDHIVSYKIDDKKYYDQSLGASWMIEGGYEHKPLRIIGIRTYLQSIMDLQPDGLETLVTTQLSINGDILVNFFDIKQKALGIYGGIGVGFMQSQKLIVDTGINLFYGLFLLNTGFEFTFNESNHVQLGVKIPFVFNNSRIGTPLHIILAYHYSF